MDGTAEKSQEKSIKPGFLGGKGGGETPAGLNTENPGLGREEAAQSLGEAEKAAEGGLYNRGDNLDGAREAEKGGFYSGAAATAANVATRGKFKGRFKKGGPLVGIIFVIFGVGALMGGTQFFQPFSLIAQFQETFNSMQKSTNARSTRWMRWQLGDTVKDPVKGSKIFGSQHFKISDKQAEELKKQGVEYDKDGNGGKGVLRYADANGEVKEVTASNFRKTYDTDTDFFHKYSSGSMTWRGQFANWFGTNTTSFLKNNKITRNLFSDFKNQKAANDGNGLEVVRKKLANRTKSIEYGGTRIVETEEDATDEAGERVQATDEDGTPLYYDEDKTQPIYEDKLKTESNDSGTIDRSSLDEGKIRTKIESVAGRFNSAANVGCAVMGAAGAINLLIAANEAIQIVNLTSAYFETVNKTQAGQGDNAPINELTNTLNMKEDSEYVLVNSSGSDTETKSVTGRTAMQSAGVAALYGGGRVNTNDPSVQGINPMSSMSRVLGGLGVAVSDFENCAIAKAGAAAVSAIVDGLTIAGCLAGILGAAFTFGVSAVACEPLVANIALQVAGGIAISAAIGALIAIITPVAVSTMTNNLVDTLAGEDLGNALTSGANMYQGGAHRGNGGSLSTASKYTEYAVLQQQVVADNARYERADLSPFDITSKNTFMGTIMTQLMSFNTVSSLMGAVTTGGSVISSSLAGLNSSMATAMNVADALPNMDESADDYYGKTCPYLASIGAVGDAFCNPYIMTDVSTMDDDPGTVIDIVDGYEGFEDNESSDGNVVIKKDSDLAKYIVFCDNRSSAFGVADYDIASTVGDFGTVVTGNSLADTVVNGAIGSVPVIGDVVEIINDVQQLDNVGYISGESCVAGNDVDAAQSPDWSKAKYYQRFIEDQSLAESMGLISKSAVAVYLEDYYKENPLDNSYEGMLARYSGLDKQTVTDLLDIIAYYDYINNYDASERYAFDGVEAEAEIVYLFDEENILDGDVVRPENIVYADVRNRTFVV